MGPIGYPFTVMARLVRAIHEPGLCKARMDPPDEPGDDGMELS